jgi:hypothetical protein
MRIDTPNRPTGIRRTCSADASSAVQRRGGDAGSRHLLRERKPTPTFRLQLDEWLNDPEKAKLIRAARILLRYFYLFNVWPELPREVRPGDR